jgi:aspartyl-tRNA(Asn)/glutamyl-tRNA(Gln) amidotransferase subunit A
MGYMNKTIDEIHKALKSKEVTPLDLTKEAIELSKKYQDKFNLYVTITEKEALDFVNKLGDNIDNPLYGIPYGLKDNFSTKDILTTASSNILKDYVPFFNATVVEKLNNCKAICVGKTVLDELAMGGTSTTGHTGSVKNPWDENRLIGGSSGGSAAAVAAGVVPYAIGSDTGDSVRKPAAYGGVVGFKPTWGRISRYGLFPFACSLDHVGVLTRCVKDAAYVVDAIKGKDEKDMTTLPDENIKYAEKLDGNVKGKKLFYIKEMLDRNNYKDDMDEELKMIFDSFENTIEKCKEAGMSVEEVSFPMELLEAIFPTYITISCAEATSNNSNLTGIIFGPRGEGNTPDEIMFDARTKGFSELIKRRFVIGSYVLQKENQERLFLNAQRIRRLIVERMNELFKTYDGLILPCSGRAAPKAQSENIDRLSFRELVLENHLAIGNFGGYPSITIPTDLINDLPIAVNITGPTFKDLEVLNMAYALESKLNMKGIIAKGGNR